MWHFSTVALFIALQALKLQILFSESKALRSDFKFQFKSLGACKFLHGGR
jgi:hypothetical protein